MMWGGKRNWKPRCTSASYKSESSKDASYWAGGPRGYVLKVVILLESWKYHRNLSVAKLLRASWRLEAHGEISTLPWGLGSLAVEATVLLTMPASEPSVCISCCLDKVSCPIYSESKNIPFWVRFSRYNNLFWRWKRSQQLKFQFKCILFLIVIIIILIYVKYMDIFIHTIQVQVLMDSLKLF